MTSDQDSPGPKPAAAAAQAYDPEVSQRIASNIASIRQDIDAAARRSGRPPESVRLVAVSKTVGPAQIAAAIAAGQRDFAENRSNLFAERQAAFPEADWHFIGRIQTNKVKVFTGPAALVHSVASERALLAIDRRATALGLVQPLLIEVNTSGEESKDGVTPGELDALIQMASTLAAVRVDGLMTMAPIADEPVVRRCFADLREALAKLRSSFQGAGNLPLGELSMGMSDDFVIAVEEGATIVRIGRGIWRDCG